MINQQCAAKGFDAVETDLDETYAGGDGTTGFTLTEADEVTYMTTLANYMHRDGLAWIIKNPDDTGDNYAATMERWPTACSPSSAISTARVRPEFVLRAQGNLQRRVQHSNEPVLCERRRAGHQWGVLPGRVERVAQSLPSSQRIVLDVRCTPEFLGHLGDRRVGDPVVVAREQRHVRLLPVHIGRAFGAVTRSMISPVKPAASASMSTSVRQESA